MHQEQQICQTSTIKSNSHSSIWQGLQTELVANQMTLLAIEVWKANSIMAVKRSLSMFLATWTQIITSIEWGKNTPSKVREVLLNQRLKFHTNPTNQEHQGQARSLKLPLLASKRWRQLSKHRCQLLVSKISKMKSMRSSRQDQTIFLHVTYEYATNLSQKKRKKWMPNLSMKWWPKEEMLRSTLSVSSVTLTT